MKIKNIFIILGIVIAVGLITFGSLRLFFPTTLSTILGEEFIPLKINNRDISCNSNQDCKNAILSKFPSATNLDVTCVNEICSVKAIKSGGGMIK